VTWKPVHYRDHAAERLQQRHVRHWEVRQLLATGVRTKQGAAPPGHPELQRWHVEGTLGGYPARVVFHERAREIEVVTVMWVGRDADEEGRR